MTSFENVRARVAGNWITAPVLSTGNDGTLNLRDHVGQWMRVQQRQTDGLSDLIAVIDERPGIHGIDLNLNRLGRSAGVRTSIRACILLGRWRRRGSYRRVQMDRCRHCKWGQGSLSCRAASEQVHETADNWSQYRSGA